MKKIVHLIIVSAMFITFSACNKPSIIDEGSQEQIEETRTMDDLEVSADFDWKTTKDIQLKLSGEGSGVVYVNTVDGNNYHKALLNSQSDYVTKITVPSYVKELALSYNGQSNTVLIDNGLVEYNFN